MRGRGQSGVGPDGRGKYTMQNFIYFSKTVRLLNSLIVYEYVNFLSSLFTLCYFFLYLKMVLYVHDCSCTCT